MLGQIDILIRILYRGEKSTYINRLKESEEQSEKLVQLVNEYSSLLYRTAYIYCKNKMDAEEIVQETYLKYLNKKPCFESKQHEKAWFLHVWFIILT